MDQQFLFTSLKWPLYVTAATWPEFAKVFSCLLALFFCPNVLESGAACRAFCKASALGVTAVAAGPAQEAEEDEEEEDEEEGPPSAP